jgi:hypothetical protein
LEERSVTADDQDIFEDEVPATTTEGVSPEAPAGQPRDESGRFAAKDQGEASPEAPEAAEAAPDGAPPAPAEKRHDVPITALLDEREKRQRAEQRAAFLEAQMRQQQPKPELPDPAVDAEGYTRFLAQSFEQRMQSMVLNQSRFMAEREFGKELIEEAMSFFDNQPYEASARFLREPSPFHAAVEWFKGEKERAERSAPDFETKLRAKIEAELREKWQAEAETPQSTRPNVPRSLAEASGSGRPPPTAGGDPLFD